VEKTNKSLKEWNAIIEALAGGLQTIIIRKNPTTLKGFFLYPTFSYATKENYLENFKKDFRHFVEKNAFPLKKGEKTQIKYYARVEKVIEISPKNLNSLNKLHIWKNDHVKKYLSNKKGYVWYLKIYKLKDSYMAEKNRGMRFANLKKEISLKDLIPVFEET
jgi:restriction system protein